MKHFLNHEMLAPNVLTVPVDLDVVNEFAELGRAKEPGPDYCTVMPWKKKMDLRWISAANEETFAIFQSAFERLDVARHVREYLDLDQDVRLYAGYLHTRSECTEPKFHVDWVLANNEAFTLLTPLAGLEAQPTLLYQKLTGETAEYRYQLGEAIMFGDHFNHSPPTGRFDPPLTLLVFQFGTDKMEHWDKLLRTQGRQCSLIQQPNGEFMTVDPYKGPPHLQDDAVTADA